MRERTLDGVAAEIMRLTGEIQAASSDLYRLCSVLPDDETLARCSITCERPVNFPNLIGSLPQFGLSLAISRAERFNMPNDFYQIVEDVVDGWHDLMVTLVLEDKEIERNVGQPGEFGLILGSSVPQRDKVRIAIPSNSDRGLFATTWAYGPKTEKEGLYQALHGRRVDSKFMEGLVAGCGWLVPKIKGRIYHGNVVPIEFLRKSA